MEVACPTCGSRILSDNMDLPNMAGKCHRCHSLFDLRAFMDAGSAQSGSTQRQCVPEPAGIRVEDSGSGLIIVRRWFTRDLYFIALFCFCWNSFLVFWYWAAFEDKNSPWLMIVFPLLHVAIGLQLTYWTLAGFLNHTIIQVDEETLSIRHVPIPWLWNRLVRVDELDQFFVEKRDAFSVEPRPKKSKIGTGFAYRLCAVTKEGKKRVLISGIWEIDHALFIARRIEEFLGIEHRPVAGEVNAVDSNEPESQSGIASG